MPRHNNTSSPRRRNNKSSLSKHKAPFSNENTIIWSNLAYNHDIVDDDCCSSSVGSNSVSSSPAMPVVTDEELRLREELGVEIEKELEREIMEGILDLVHRLSDLKAKQINRGIRNVPMDHFIDELCGSNGSDLCKIGDHVISPWHGADEGSASGGARFAFRGRMREQICESSDMESTTGRWGS